MSDSFFTIRKDAIFAPLSTAFSTKINLTPLAYGLTAGLASNYASLNGVFQTAYSASIDPATRTKAKIVARNVARTAVKQNAAELAQLINGTASVTDEQKTDLGLAVRGTPVPRPAPGTPFKFTAALGNTGALTITWKCNNPKGASGTMYQVWRRNSPTASYEYLGGSGDRMFIDNSIPAGSSQVTYKIQAVRSTSVGDFAEYNVNFGAAGSAPVVEEVLHLKKAA